MTSNIKQEAFKKYNIEKKLDTFTVRLNKDEREQLNDCKRILKQPKDSTCLKLLSSIGAKVLHDGLTGSIIKTVFENKRKNERTGYDEIYD